MKSPRLSRKGAVHVQERPDPEMEPRPLRRVHQGGADAAGKEE